jgi:hypothetical protein
MSTIDVSSLITGRALLPGTDGEGDWFGDCGGEFCEAMINDELAMSFN